MDLSHLDKKGNARMVNVSDKDVTERKAVAVGTVLLQKATILAISADETPKGNVLNTARVAAIMAAKNTAGIIPMCHTLPLNGIDVDFEINEQSITVTATAYVTAKTGVEMEALTAVSVALLTIYDMVKAIDKTMIINDVKLMSKSGGRSGEYKRGE